jgi:hypothetical protein
MRYATRFVRRWKHVHRTIPAGARASSADLHAHAAIGHDDRPDDETRPWTALQLDWAEDARNRKICQLTHPETVHAFLQEWPGLQECARNNPATLALYAPQLAIPGFDNGFAGLFDELMAPEKTDICDAFRYGAPSTTDGKEPLCGDFVAWRHPSYGNYTASELSYEFVNAHDGSYSRKLFNGFECLVWLLSHDANWMPDR